MVKLVSRLRRDWWPEDGMTFENFGDRPMHFKTKNDLKAHCKATGLSSGALL